MKHRQYIEKEKCDTLNVHQVPESFFKDFWAYSSEMFNDKYYTEVFYHYTSPEAFIQIIQNRTLWFSRCDCLNDYKENQIIKDLYPQCLNELYKEGRINQEAYDEYNKVEITHKVAIQRPNGLSEMVPSTPYVCCFSMKQDSLQMWQYYAKAGNYEGYNIGFRFSKLRQYPKRIVRLGKIIYDQDKQKEIIKNALLKINTLDSKNNESSGIKQYSLDFVASEMSLLGCFFKDECFSGEEEVRLVIQMPENPKEREEGIKQGMMGNGEMPKIQYRITHAMLIPYFDCKYTDIGNITCVTIGPVTSQKNESAEKNKDMVELFLQDKTQRMIKVTESRVPVRY